MKFRAAFQVKEFVHLHSMIASIPNLRTSLDNTIAFVGEQLRSAKQQNTSHQSRNLSSYTKTSGKSAEKVTHKKWVNPKSKKYGKKGKKGKKAATKFDPNYPGAYVTKATWLKMTETQRQASRDARNEQGVPRKASIKSLETKMDQSVDEVKQAIAAINSKRKVSAVEVVEVPEMTQRDTRPTAVFYVDADGNAVSKK